VHIGAQWLLHPVTCERHLIGLATGSARHLVPRVVTAALAPVYILQLACVSFGHLWMLLAGVARGAWWPLADLQHVFGPRCRHGHEQEQQERQQQQ
jgi:hypothetical protein